MPHELESLRDQMNRLEQQLRLIKIAAVLLSLLAIAFALLSGGADGPAYAGL